jgi:hypothetical protein
MSDLLHAQPFAPRDDAAFLREINALSLRHLAGCEPYRRMWPDWSGADSIDGIPFVHVGVFKHLLLRTTLPEIRHQRILTSSATSGAALSRIALDQQSSALQSQSSLAILREMVGPQLRPLLVLDAAESLRRPGEVSARIAAAMSLRPLASQIHFLLADAGDPRSVDWDRLRDVLRGHDDLLVYGFTWILWAAWGGSDLPADVRSLLRGKRIHFVHSGGWKKLEDLRVDPERLRAALVEGLAPQSRVIDFYGLVEQIGILYPLCECGFRHAPGWAEVLVRDPWTLRPLIGEVGALQLMNVLALGAPYHSVLTEDLGRRVEGDCPCGRAGRRFELLGRMAQAETRGCANV